MNETPYASSIDLSQYISEGEAVAQTYESPAQKKRAVKAIMRQMGCPKRAGAWSPKKARNQKRR